MRFTPQQIILAFLLCVFSAQVRAASDPNEAAWALLKQGGYAVVMRHSLDEPGTGDPPGYRYGDCSTQRQLIPEGREKARRVGKEFRKRQIPIGEVLSSEWCRARDTAEIAFGRHKTWSQLNVMNPQTNPYMDVEKQNTAVTASVAEHSKAANIVLVTHYLNIGPLLNAYPQKGDAIIARYDEQKRQLVVVGELRFP